MANRIYLCLAHMSDAGLEQKYIKEAFILTRTFLWDLM